MHTLFLLLSQHCHQQRIFFTHLSMNIFYINFCGAQKLVSEREKINSLHMTSTLLFWRGEPNQGRTRSPNPVGGGWGENHGNDPHGAWQSAAGGQLPLKDMAWSHCGLELGHISLSQSKPTHQFYLQNYSCHLSLHSALQCIPIFELLSILLLLFCALLYNFIKYILFILTGAFIFILGFFVAIFFKCVFVSFAWWAEGW